MFVDIRGNGYLALALDALLDVWFISLRYLSYFLTISRTTFTVAYMRVGSNEIIFIEKYFL